MILSHHAMEGKTTTQKNVNVIEWQFPFYERQNRNKWEKQLSRAVVQAPGRCLFRKLEALASIPSTRLIVLGNIFTVCQLRVCTRDFLTGHICRETSCAFSRAPQILLPTRQRTLGSQPWVVRAGSGNGILQAEQDQVQCHWEVMGSQCMLCLGRTSEGSVGCQSAPCPCCFAFCCSVTVLPPFYQGFLNCFLFHYSRKDIFLEICLLPSTN